jgi:N-acetylglucosaminyl-diphospho-decaprenol L-rhamnosyltransferase
MADRDPELSLCIVNTSARELLLACLDSIFANAPRRSFEVLVLDNASDDGSAAAVKARYGDEVELVEHARRRGKAVNDSELVDRARGRFCLLLNEDSALTPDSADLLVDALEEDHEAAAAGARLIGPNGRAQSSAWRFPGVLTALVGALFLHRRFTVQSKGDRTREVDWVQSAGMLIRKTAFESVGPMDSAFFLYSDEVDWQKRARGAGWSILYVPQARIVHREQLSHGKNASARVVEFSRNRDLFMRKHRGRAAAALVRVLVSITYALRAAAALVLRGHSSRRYLTHAYYSLLPRRGTGLREAADDYNRALDDAESINRKESP